uniref:helix-turn-helix domain-containing protein n=1 Tax=Candidatus Fimivicinus sp. TaxID=3056640 RepID=UPI003FEFE1D1
MMPLRIGEAVKERILELCEENNFTVNYLATISGVPQSTLNNIVNGRNNSTTVSTLQKLCDGFQISIIDFFNVPLFENIEQEIK